MFLSRAATAKFPGLVDRVIVFARTIEDARHAISGANGAVDRFGENQKRIIFPG